MYHIYIHTYTKLFVLSVWRLNVSLRRSTTAISSSVRDQLWSALRQYQGFGLSKVILRWFECGWNGTHLDNTWCMKAFPSWGFVDSNRVDQHTKSHEASTQPRFAGSAHSFRFNPKPSHNRVAGLVCLDKKCWQAHSWSRYKVDMKILPLHIRALLHTFWLATLAPSNLQQS